MKNLSKILIMCLAVLIGNCSPVYEVYYDYDRTVDFSSLGTYGWLSLETQEQRSDLVKKRIKLSVNSQLESKGYKTVSDNPDFLVLAKVTTKREWWGGGGRYGGHSTQFEAGTLLLDFIDARSKDLIWRGSASAVLDYNLSPDKLDKLVEDVVQSILKKFPPPASK